MAAWEPPPREHYGGCGVDLACAAIVLILAACAVAIIIAAWGL